MPSTSKCATGQLPNRTPTEQFRFRQYRLDDLDALYRLDVECFDPPFRFSRANLKQFLEDARAWTFVVEMSSAGDSPAEIVAFILVHFAQENGIGAGYIVTLDVSAGLRRRGLGRALMQQAERAVQERGGSTLRLHAFTGNDSARRFYARLGYVDLGCVEGFYGELLEARLLSKRIEPSIANTL